MRQEFLSLSLSLSLFAERSNLLCSDILKEDEYLLLLSDCATSVVTTDFLRFF